MTANLKVLCEALSRIGIREFAGKQASPSILSWIKELLPYAKDDETNWCSLFVRSVVRKALGEDGLIKITSAARSWLDYGVPTTTPEIGDVVVLWRGSEESWQGHVGIYIRENTEYVFLLGGNQNNAVNISPYKKDRVLGFRKHPQIPEV